MSRSPLHGIKVLDLSRVVAGPLVGQTLADLGASVVKVERPGEGDDLRKVGPPWLGGDKKAGEPSTYFLAVNRGKQSIEIDFDNDDDCAQLRGLAAEADVVIENFRTGTLAKRGLGYEDLAKINPRIIVCSVTGFGQTGPRASESGYDYLAQAMSGLMSLNGHAPGDAGDGPMRIGVPIVDIIAAKDATIAILAALRARDASGRGQHVDVSLFDSAIGTILNPASSALNGGGAIEPSGNIHPSAFPYGVFPARDGNLLIATFTDSGFAGICDVVGRPEWVADERFRTPGNRVRNRDELGALLSEELGREDRSYWIPRFNAAKVSCGAINTVAEALEDPQVAARGLVVTTEHPVLGTLRGIRFPVTVTDQWEPAKTPPPLVGEHDGGASLIQRKAS